MTYQTAAQRPTAPSAVDHMRSRDLVRLLLPAAVSALLAACASRPWGLGLLALVAYVPAFDVIATARTPLTGAVIAAAASFGVASVGYEATAAIGVHVYVLALVLAPLPYAAAGAIAVRFGHSLGSVRPGRDRGPRHLAVLAALPVLWCAAEWLPAQPWLWGTMAMPLGAIGYSQAELPTLQLASLSSVTAVSAAVLIVNALVVVTWRARLPVHRVAALTALAGIGLLVALVSQPGTAEQGADAAVVRLVQPNLPDSVYLAANKLTDAKRALAARLAELATSARTDRGSEVAALTILPEAAWPGPFDVDSSPVDQVDRLLSGSQLPEPLLFGAPSTGRTTLDPSGSSSDHRRSAAWFANSVFLLNDGVLTRVQDKLHLVPIAETGLRAGSGPVVFSVGALRVAALVCYDVAFPASARAAAQGGASLVAVLTDDSFAARGDVPRLHVRLAVFRAVETGLPVALASNTGPSVLVDATGRTVARSPALVATSLTAALPLGRRRTPYAAYGDWLGVLASLGTVAIGAVAAARGGGAGSFGPRPT